MPPNLGTKVRVPRKQLDHMIYVVFKFSSSQFSKLYLYALNLCCKRVPNAHRDHGLHCNLHNSTIHPFRKRNHLLITTTHFVIQLVLIALPIYRDFASDCISVAL